ncbi:MAG: M48 family metalloprotease [Myxococcota bacterium]
MRFVTTGLLLALMACQSMVRTEVPAPSVGSALGSAADFSRAKAQFDACEALGARPLAFPDEAVLGARAAMLLLDAASKDVSGADGGVARAPPWLELTEEELAPIDENVNHLGKGLAAFSGRPGLPWTFVVVDLERPFFFAVGGGAVFVSAGLLSRVENEAQLATVLALGIARVDRRHTTEVLQRARKVACLQSTFNEAVQKSLLHVVPGVPWTDGLPSEAERQLAKAMTSLLYSQDAEAWEADTVETAVQLAAFAGYQPLEGARLLEALPPPHGAHGTRLDGGALGAAVRAAAERETAGLRLTTPPSKAADLVFRKAAARQPKTMP